MSLSIPGNVATLAQISSFVSELQPDHKFVLAIIVIGCVTAILITTVIATASAWATVRQNETRAELTRDLLDEGKSAEEIERIINPADGFSRAIGSWGKKKD